MDEVRESSSMQFYYLWRNFAIGLLCVVVTIVATHMLPFFMAPAVSLFICAVLYTIILNNDSDEHPMCMVMMQTVYYCILSYTFVAIVLVVMELCDVVIIPVELSFFTDPYLPALILMPVSFLVSLLACIFKKSMPACRRCRVANGGLKERGSFGIVSLRETNLQLRNMVWLFAVLTVIVWWYFLFSYIDVNQNARDWYVFVWVVVLLVILDEVYFMIRYFNLFVDLEEHDEIVSQQQLNELSAYTYLRFYVICGEYVFLNPNTQDRVNGVNGVYETPFVIKKSADEVGDDYVATVAEELIGIPGGESRLFYGSLINGEGKYSMMRFLYFLDGDKSLYPKLSAAGEWVSFSLLKNLYSTEPMKLSVNTMADILRLYTIIITEKTYDDNGMRKIPIRSFSHDITHADLRNSEIDMKDDKWIRIAEFNSDSRFFKLKRFLRKVSGIIQRGQSVNC